MIELKNITKVYHLGEIDLPVLKGISLRIEDGEFVSLTGASGSGKSTLMNILGCLDHPTSGEFWIDGHNVAGLNANERALLRNKRIGFVFQNFNLLARTSALENVMMPALIGGFSLKEAKQKATQLLEELGLGVRLEHKPAELSGGEKQRVAVARALINSPKVIFADEPTGSLDSQNREELQQIFVKLKNKYNQTFVIVTHDSSLSSIADRVVLMKDGRIEEIIDNNKKE